MASSRGPEEFPTTHWSLVLSAGRPSDPGRRDSLAALCEAYWFPLYAYARRKVRDVDQAQEMTQSFLTELLEKQALGVAAPERGRFRSFLLAAFRNFMANEWDRLQTQKRGGGAQHLSLDFEFGERRYAREPADHLTPELLFERQWALSLLDHVLRRLQHELAGAGKADHFERLGPFLTPHAETPSYAEVAAAWGTSEGAVAVAVHRLRRRYRDLLREEIAHTVAEPAEVDDEIRSLFAALRQ